MRSVFLSLAVLATLCVASFPARQVQAQAVTEDVNDPQFLVNENKALVLQNQKLSAQYKQLAQQGLSIATIRKVLWPSIVQDFNAYSQIMAQTQGFVQQNIQMEQQFANAMHGYHYAVRPQDWIAWWNNTANSGKALMTQAGLIQTQEKAAAVQSKVSLTNLDAAVGTKGAIQGLGAIEGQLGEQLNKLVILKSMEVQNEQGFRNGQAAHALSRHIRRACKRAKERAVNAWLMDATPPPMSPTCNRAQDAPSSPAPGGSSAR